MIEEWKEVEGYTSYEVSTKGGVREKSTFREIPKMINGGFWCTNLISDFGKGSLCKVHRLVAIAFIPNPESSYFVDPVGDRLDTDVSNWVWRPKTIKPEKIVKEEKTYLYFGVEYTLEQFVQSNGLDKVLTRSRLKSGWTTTECVLGSRTFYVDELFWYPTKAEYDQTVARKRAIEYLKRKEQAEVERLEAIEQRKQNKLAYKKWGVGNFINYPIPGIEGRLQLKVYRVWSGMISRCYSTKNHSYPRYGGRGVYVCEEWKEFQNFAVWYYEQYQEDDWHIDKDILSPEDDVRYSPDTCVFIPAALNTLLATMQDQMRDLPMGVMRTKREGVYSCQYMLNGARTHKAFTNIHEAAVHYKTHKELEIKRMVGIYKDKLPNKIYQFFLDYTIDIREEFQNPS